ncbi:hypothetical protein OG21DRAFT_1482871 [Imleria badia]|nr:hypothetical protein OG21DRAFT_1482871 [Imleria badia]
MLSLRALLLVAGLLVYINRRYLGDALAYYTGSSTIAACLILAGSLIAVALALGDAIVPHLKFIWHCFIRPLGATDQRTRLDKAFNVFALIECIYDDERLSYKLLRSARHENGESLGQECPPGRH